MREQHIYSMLPLLVLVVVLTLLPLDTVVLVFALLR